MEEASRFAGRSLVGRGVLVPPPHCVLVLGSRGQARCLWAQGLGTHKRWRVGGGGWSEQNVSGGSTSMAAQAVLVLPAKPDCTWHDIPKDESTAYIQVKDGCRSSQIWRFCSTAWRRCKPDGGGGGVRIGAGDGS